jgi:SAM-dependent methyltransferase
MIMTAHKTAKARKTISAPMKYLSEQGLLVGIKLDYGCGKGFDADHFGMYKYDPFYTGGKIKSHEGLEVARDAIHFDVITSNYVFNVIEDPTIRQYALDVITGLLKPGGKAYITVRRDVVNAGITKTGTYQENVVLDLPVLVEVKGKYCIYVQSKSI